jgi:hypothetical protein
MITLLSPCILRYIYSLVALNITVWLHSCRPAYYGIFTLLSPWILWYDYSLVALHITVWLHSCRPAYYGVLTLLSPCILRYDYTLVALHITVYLLSCHPAHITVWLLAHSLNSNSKSKRLSLEQIVRVVPVSSTRQVQHTCDYNTLQNKPVRYKRTRECPIKVTLPL